MREESEGYMNEIKPPKLVLPIGFLIAVSLLSIIYQPRSSDQAYANGAYQILMPFITKKLSTAPGTVIGKVVDATTNLPTKYGSAHVCFGTLCATANAQGDYTLTGVPYGMQELTAGADYYFEKKSSVIVKGGGTAVLNYAIYPSVSGGSHGMQVVLTWRSERTWSGKGCIFEGNPDPSGNCLNDLDSHFWVIPFDTGLPTYHIHPRNKGNCSQFPSACLDLDAQWGSGPETLTIDAYEDAIYYYAVHNVYQYFSLTVPHLSDTQARVQVYKTDNGIPKLVLDKMVPITGGSRDLEAWLVFTLNGSTGDLLEQNCLTYIWPSDLEPPTCP
jgi:hypothetical protein